MEQARITEKGKLVTEKKWQEHIKNLEINNSATRDALKAVLIEAIKKRIPKEKFGIMFSGGIDSTLIALICKQQKANFKCYAVGIENSTDLIAAKKAAKLLGINVIVKQYSLEEAEKIIKNVIAIVGTEIVNVGVGSVVYACAELGKEDNIKKFFTGLGSEEIFAGYERHEAAGNVNSECWDGLKKMWKRDFKRDKAIGKTLGFTTLTPFLDEDLIKTAMKIPGKEKIKKGYKKYPLRILAEELGLPKEIAWRKKQAAQYGSKFDRAILRLAKRAGFKYKKDYINSI